MSEPNPYAAQLLGRSLLVKTLLVVGVAAAVVATVIVIILLTLTGERVNEEAKGRLNELVDSMSVMASIACYAKDVTLAGETAQAFVKHGDVDRVTIIAYGKQLAQAERAGGAAPASNYPPVRRALRSPFVADEVIGEVVVDPNWREIQKKIANSVHATKIALLMMVAAIFAVLIVVVAYFVVRPVKQISDRLHALDPASGDVVAMPVGHEANELGRLVGDINELVNRQRESLQRDHELRLQRVINDKLRLAAAVFEHSQEGIAITDKDNRIVAVNRAFTEITGYPEEDVIGKNPSLLSSGRQDRLFYEQMWHSIIATGHWQGELWNRCKGGQIKPKWYSINTVKDEAGQVVNYIAIFSDISERKRAEQHIEFLAHHDALTGLPNRVLTRDRFSQAAVRALRDRAGVAVLYIDLDNFKNINDSCGHQTGDQLLIDAVARLQHFIRDSDTISRQGGDEFIVLLPGVSDPDAVNRVAYKMIEALSAPFEIDDQHLGISASIGIAYFPDDSNDFDTLVRYADAAMYAAKSAGKNTYRRFVETMVSDNVDTLQLKLQLRTAVEQGQFELHYQPQVELRSGRLIGAEALLRWRHPELGVVPPGRFIPLAESSGQIHPIGEWVLAEACRQGQEWRQAGLEPFTIAVNISAQQFKRGNVCELVQEVLSHSGYPPEWLELELTESGLLTDVAQSLRTIEQLKALGIRLSIDDFGTGYSSLSYLRQFRVQMLKVDQAFVRDIVDDGADLEIVRAIVQLGKTLKLQVIAEGVETAAQLSLLNSLGCDHVQGYYLGRPQPAREFAKWVEYWRATSGRGRLESLLAEVGDKR